MVSDGATNCPLCGGRLIYYGTVKRLVRRGYGAKTHVYISRLVCVACGKEHRALPSSLLPYKHYEAAIIRGFLDGGHSTDELAFEDYPSDSTIRRWRAEKYI